MKSTVIKQSEKRERVYPYLGMFNEELVVLLTEAYTGTVIVAEADKSTCLGDHQDSWVEDNFTVLPKDYKVELSN